VNAVDTVTARYAEALYELARRKGKLEVVTDDVRMLAGEFASSKVRSMLLNPRFSTEARLERLEPVLSRCDELVRDFVQLLYGRNREQVLANLGAAFRKRELADQQKTEGVVESARPLGEAELAELGKGLRSRFGLEVMLENVVNEELIGGVRVRVGSQMIDMSVSGRLTALRDRMERAPLAGTSAG
jgi:F-type H+-transporting ATPase subunit delta